VGGFPWLVYWGWLTALIITALVLTCGSFFPDIPKFKRQRDCAITRPGKRREKNRNFGSWAVKKTTHLGEEASAVEESTTSER